MTRKKTKFCLSWPNKTLKISGRLQNIAILLTERTIMPCSNLILPLSALFYRMWRHFLLDDSDTQKVPGVAECSPPPLYSIYMYSVLCILMFRFQAKPKQKSISHSQYIQGLKQGNKACTVGDFFWFSQHIQRLNFREHFTTAYKLKS